ncbi:MAG: VWA domain-containing protein [Gemmatimonadales bacterium]|nr:VWA domain-containing protein [Gemmatimonadales bacterium]
MRFAEPLALVLLVVPLLLAWRRWRRAAPGAAIAFPVRALLAGMPVSSRVRWSRRTAWWDLVGLALCIVALARPQGPAGTDRVTLDARNIIVALDISSSMKATDFQPGNRLEVAKQVLQQFVERRDGDLVGLVIFAGKAFLQAPLTTDVRLVSRLVGDVDIGVLPDGTAIGTALAMALNQLKELPAKASTIVLITDGAQNTGKPSLAEATELARAVGIRIHAIGLSSADTAQVALNGVWSVRTRSARLSAGDEATLRRTAERTGGLYARATAPFALDSILGAIDPLERQPVIVREVRHWHELYPFLLVPGLALLVAELALRATWLRRLA